MARNFKELQAKMPSERRSRVETKVELALLDNPVEELSPDQQLQPTRIIMGPLGYLVKASSGRVITPEMVKEGSEDDLE